MDAPNGLMSAPSKSDLLLLSHINKEEQYATWKTYD